MNDTHFKSEQNQFFLKDTVEILSSPYSILLGIDILMNEIEVMDDKAKISCMNVRINLISVK